MKFLKVIGRKIQIAWKKLNEVDHEAYLRERPYMEARESARHKYLYHRGIL